MSMIIQHKKYNSSFKPSFVQLYMPINTIQDCNKRNEDNDNNNNSNSPEINSSSINHTKSELIIGEDSLVC